MTLMELRRRVWTRGLSYLSELLNHKSKSRHWYIVTKTVENRLSDNGPLFIRIWPVFTQVDLEIQGFFRLKVLVAS